MSDSPVRIAVLSGGPSREHGVSLKSGAAVATALAARGHLVTALGIRSDGRWQLGTRPSAALPAGREQTELVSLRPGAGLDEPVDVVFIALHGNYGEDGVVQGLLEAAGLVYTGSGVAASALAMDKERTKEVLSCHGVRTPPWVPVDRRSWAQSAADIVARIEEELGYPVIVKPAREGSSFGLHLARDRAALLAAIPDALESPDGRVLAERRVAGTEVSCPVMGNRGGDLETLPVVEIVPDADRELFDFAAKYEGKSREICPARLPEEVADRVRRRATTAHRVLGCDGLTRSDFIVDADGEPWFLETNTVPGMTPESLCPLSARAAGWSFEELCERVVDLAVSASRARRAGA